jgi:hypothetical protein
MWLSLLFGIVLARVTAEFTIFAVYSPFSGLVSAGAGIGTPQQQIRLALDFSDSESVLFAPSQCPIYVPRCFNQEKSNTFISLHTNTFLPHMNGLMASGVSGDVFSIAPSTLTQFSYVTNWNFESAAYRDVAGKIGLSRLSKIWRDKVVYVSDALPEVNGVRVSDKARRNRVDLITTAVGEDIHAWVMNTFLSISGEKAGSVIRIKIEFNPAEETFLIPDQYRGIISDELVKAGSRVKITAEGLIETDFKTIQIALQFVSGTVNLVSSELGGRIRFCSHCRNAVIGRPLIRSVSSVALDFRAGLIGFSSLPETKLEYLPPVPETKTLVPIYGAPTLFRDSQSGNVTITFKEEKAGSLILASLAVKWIETEDKKYSCWGFLKTRNSKNGLDSERVEGVFKGASLRVDEGQLQVKLLPVGEDGDKLRVFTENGKSFFRVCLEETGTQLVRKKFRMETPISPTACECCIT